MKTKVVPPVERRAWKALAAHHRKIRELHLRELFSEDSSRGEAMTAEAEGIYFQSMQDTLYAFQYSKLCNLISHHHAIFRFQDYRATD